MLTIDDVKLLSRQLHGNQSRRGVAGTYWIHPLSVHAMFKDMYPASSVESEHASLLHDTIEDGSVTETTLRSKGISEVTLAYLEILTRRPGETSEQHFQRVLHCGIVEVLGIKWADCMHNAYWSEDDKMWNHRWHEEQGKYNARAIEVRDMIHSILTNKSPVIIPAAAIGWDVAAWERSFKQGESA